MTGLLVSVRNALEAAVASESGADLIDVKEPTRGSLGAAEPAVWHDVLQTIGNRLPLSVALGELLQGDVEANAQQTPGYTFAKVGLAGCATVADWALRWERAIRRLPKNVEPVAVVYADWRAANSPEPAKIINLAHQLGCVAVLFDTFEKTAGNLFAHLDDLQLAEFSAHIQELGMKFVVGGSLQETTLARALRLAPDFVAVRGAACRGSRIDQIDGDLVWRLACQVQGSNAGLASVNPGLAPSG